MTDHEKMSVFLFNNCRLNVKASLHLDVIISDAHVLPLFNLFYLDISKVNSNAMSPNYMHYNHHVPTLSIHYNKALNNVLYTEKFLPQLHFAPLATLFWANLKMNLNQILIIEK